MKKTLAITLLAGVALAVTNTAQARIFVRGPHIGFGIAIPGCWGCGYYPPPYYGSPWYSPYYYGPPFPPSGYERPHWGPWHVTRRANETDYDLPDSVLFALDSAKISSNAASVLTEIANAARREPAATLIVEGHTDTSGDRAHNQQLSDARARAVADELAQQGVARDRIRTEGLGERDLAVQTGNGVREVRNRRVVVRLIHAPRTGRQDRQADTPPAYNR